MESIKKYWNAFKSIWQDILFKVAGSLFPFYLGAFILLFINKSEIHKVLDPQSFVLFSSSFLFSTLYLWYKTQNGKRTELLTFLIFLILTILIALLYSFSLISIDESLKNANEIDIALWAYLIFFTTLFLFIYYECKDWIKKENTKPYEETKRQYDNLTDSFDKLFEDEQ